MSSVSTVEHTQWTISPLAGCTKAWSHVHSSVLREEAVGRHPFFAQRAR